MMGKVSSKIKTALSMKENLNRARGTEKEKLFIIMAINMREILLTINMKAKEYINLETDKFMKES